MSIAGTPKPGAVAAPETGIGAQPDALWAFAKALWAAPGVEAVCLDWQARFGLDVSFLFWVGWLAAARGIALSEAEIRDANRAVSEWRLGVIEPARAVRKTVRAFDPRQDSPDHVAVYRDLRGVELAAERIEQRMLLDWQARRRPSGLPGESQPVVSAMRRAVERTGGRLGTDDLAALREIAGHAHRLTRR